jgi:hypothetical protein
MSVLGISSNVVHVKKTGAGRMWFGIAGSYTNLEDIRQQCAYTACARHHQQCGV